MVSSPPLKIKTPGTLQVLSRHLFSDWMVIGSTVWAGDWRWWDWRQDWGDCSPVSEDVVQTGTAAEGPRTEDSVAQFPRRERERINDQCWASSVASLIISGFQPKLPSASVLKVGNLHVDSTLKSEIPDASGAGLGLPHQANDGVIEWKAGPGAGRQEDMGGET